MSNGLRLKLKIYQKYATWTALAILVISLLTGLIIYYDYSQRRSTFLANTASNPHHLSIERCTVLFDCANYNGVVDITVYRNRTREACEAEGREKVANDIKENGDSILTRYIIECRPLTPDGKKLAKM